jgi:hypothetical protein
MYRLECPVLRLRYSLILLNPKPALLDEVLKINLLNTGGEVCA